MEVDAVIGKGKGEEKGKTKKGKDKGKSKGKDKGKGKADSSGGSTTPFQGECSYCGRWGRKRAECRKRLQQQPQQQQQQPQQQPSSSSSSAPHRGQTSQVHAEVAAVKEEEADWVLAICASAADVSQCATQQMVMGDNEGGHTCYILLDSGSDEHVAPSEFYPAGKEVTGSCLTLTDVQGHPITERSTKAREVPFCLVAEDGSHINAKAVVQIAPVRGPVLSCGKLWRAGYKVCETHDGQPCLRKGSKFVPLHLRRNSLYLKVTLGRRLMQQVAPLGAEAQEDVPMLGAENRQENAEVKPDAEHKEVGLDIARGSSTTGEQTEHQRLSRSAPVLGPGSKVEDLRRELGAPIYGTKQQMWERLMEFEARASAKEKEREYLEARSKELEEAGGNP
eukprot:6461044-Amphidinium_carterae.1